MQLLTLLGAAVAACWAWKRYQPHWVHPALPPGICAVAAFWARSAVSDHVVVAAALGLACSCMLVHVEHDAFPSVVGAVAVDSEVRLQEKLARVRWVAGFGTSWWVDQAAIARALFAQGTAALLGAVCAAIPAWSRRRGRLDQKPPPSIGQ